MDKKNKNKELIDFKNATWDYMLEHSDIMQGGAIFVKFHTKSKSQLMGHIESRAKGYHREDPKEKERQAGYVFEQHTAKKKKKSEKWKADKRERADVFKKVGIENRIRKYPAFIKFFLRKYLTYTTK